MGGTGPISATLVPPGDDPSFGPSVNSQTLPATSATSAAGPAAAFACSSVEKLSIRQNNGPGGSCSIFFSATDLISNSCAEATDDDNNKAAIAAAHSKCLRLEGNKMHFICDPPPRTTIRAD